MANPDHLQILEKGVDVWNEWRERNPGVEPNLEGEKEKLSRIKLPKINLSYARLEETNLRYTDLSEANLSKAVFTGADLFRTKLCGADLTHAQLHEASLRETFFFKARLNNANLSRAELTETDFRQAILDKVNLSNAHIVQADFSGAIITNCQVYGIAAWSLKLEGTIQSELIITQEDSNAITVDNLELAQFIYLLLDNKKIREIIDTTAKKAALILGPFEPPERKEVLDAVRYGLRQHGYWPIMFDFAKPQSRDLEETVRLLAHLSRFVVADITEPRSVPHELKDIVPNLAVPVVPLLLEGATGEYGLFSSLSRKYHWVLPVHHYKDLFDLIASLSDKVIAPAEAKAKELQTA